MSHTKSETTNAESRKTDTEAPKTYYIKLGQTHKR